MKIQLNKPYVDDEIKERVLNVLDSGFYVLGKNCKELEENFAKYIGVKHTVLVNTGTSALFLSLVALGIKDGDEVIVPAHTDFSTIEAIFYTGAVPRFIDIEENSFNMDPKKIKDLITEKTKAILPVHMYGQPANIKEISKIAKENSLFLIEDCCQAHGAEFNGKKIGSYGDTGCFSFYVAKNMTVDGDGGIVVTNNDEIADKIRLLRNHGRKVKYKHEVLGYNYRFNEINAAIGLVQLKKLPEFVENRRKVAALYKEKLRGIPNITIPQEIHGKHAYHLFVIRTKKRDELLEFLENKGIQVLIHYPFPTHTQEGTIRTFKERTLPELPELPITEKITKEILSLPMHPTLSEEEISYIADSIKEFFNK